MVPPMQRSDAGQVDHAPDEMTDGSRFPSRREPPHLVRPPRWRGLALAPIVASAMGCSRADAPAGTASATPTPEATAQAREALREELIPVVRRELRDELRPAVLAELRDELRRNAVASEPGARPANPTPPTGANTPRPGTPALPPGPALAPTPGETERPPVPSEDLWTTPGTTIWPSAGGIRLVQLVVGTGLEDKLPVGAELHYAQMPELLYCYTVFDNPLPDQTITHVWRRSGRLVSRVELEVGKSPKWRTWSKQKTQPHWSGIWSCEVLGPDGTQLGLTVFQVGG